MSILGELKRRKVIQVATVYAVVAWLLVQIITAIEAPLALPDWVDTLVIVLLAIGFPIALILSWAFDVTPDGIRTTGPSDAATPAAQPSATFTYVVQGLVLLAVGFLLANQYTDFGTAQPVRPNAGGTTRFSFDFHFTGGNTWYRVVAVTSDGDNLAYTDGNNLVLRPFDTLESRVVMEDISPTSLMSSPDGQLIGYLDRSERQLRQIPLSGGAPSAVGSDLLTERIFGLTWAADGTIIFSRPDGIYRIDGQGEAQLVVPIVDERIPLWPQLLPDGEHLIFSLAERGNWDGGEIVVESLETSDRKVLLSGGSNVRYLPTGHLLYALGNTLYAIPFDAESLNVYGTAVPVVSGISRSVRLWERGVAQFDVSLDGTLVYVRAPEVRRNSLVWVDRNGKETTIPVPIGDLRRPRLSPDDSRVLIDQEEPVNTVLVWDLGNETLTPLRLGSNGGDAPIWMLDGERIAYHPGIETRIDWHYWNNLGQPQRLYTGGSDTLDPFHPKFISSTGDVLIFESRYSSKTSIDIAMLSLESEIEMRWLIKSPANEQNPVLSPDDQWIAYQSDESGRPEIYVRPFPGVDDNRWQVSNRGGNAPLWSPDDRELFYIEPGQPNRLVSASVSTDGGEFAVSQRSIVLDWPYDTADSTRHYDVSNDGQRFVAIKVLNEDTRSPQIVVVRNWFEELRRLVPVE